MKNVVRARARFDTNLWGSVKISHNLAIALFRYVFVAADLELVDGRIMCSTERFVRPIALTGITLSFAGEVNLRETSRLPGFGSLQTSYGEFYRSPCIRPT
ncbi:hypothetical protein VTO73DRAFT_10442 [Trametes versicolor]